MLSVGEIFRNKREEKGLKLHNIEKSIRIREKFLIAVEENNWDMFPSKIYVTGIIKNYARFLGIDQKKALAFFQRDYEKKEEIKFKQRVSSKYLDPDTKKIRFFIISLIFMLFVVYFSFQLKSYLAPPNISILEPKNSVIRREDKIKIVGKIDKDGAISIFGERVYPNKEGVFEYVYALKEGKNELIINVVGANGKKKVLKQEYILKK